MANHQISGPTLASHYSATTFDPVIPCTVVSTRPGVTHRQVWSTPPIPGITPGSDANNLNLTFALRDSFGLPTINVALPPNIDDYIAGAWTGDTAGFAAVMCDCWIVLPSGINSISLRSRIVGNHSIGFYLGKSFRYAKRYAWNVSTFTTGAIDLGRYSLLCGQRVIAARMYVCNGYFHYGYYLQWDIGAGFVDVPVANTHGEQPSQSSWPN